MQLAILCLAFVIVSLLAFLIYQNTKLKSAGPQPEGSAAQVQEEVRQRQETQNRLTGVEAALGETRTELAVTSAHCASAKKTCEETQQRHDTLAQTHQRVVEEHQAKLQSVEAALAANRVSLASMQANYDHARRAGEEVQTHVITLTTRNDELRHQYQDALRLSSTAQAQADSLEKQAQGRESALERISKQLEEKSSTLETNSQALGVAQEQYRQEQEQTRRLQTELSQANEHLREKTRELLETQARLQMEEQTADRFEAIGSKLLDATLEKAQTSIEGLAKGLTQASNLELQKHAEQVAKTLEPLHSKLAEYGNAVEGFRSSSHDLFGQVKQQIGTLQEAEKALHSQAQALTSALSSGPKVRGNYGEMILKRLVEFVGMQERCHFAEQDVQNTSEGRKIPDMVFHLPGDQKVVVDSKAVVNACADAQNASSDEERAQHLKKHCQNVRGRVDELHSKGYAHLYKDSVEAVVLFLPAEHLYATAVENDIELMEYAMSKGVILCGPNALLLLLKVANHLWKQASIEEEAQRIAKLGGEIYKHTANFLDHHNTLGKHIRSLAKAYDTSCGTLEGSLLYSGREMDKLR